MLFDKIFATRCATDSWKQCLFLSIISVLLSYGCSIPFQVRDVVGLGKIQTVVVVPIAVSDSQKELVQSHYQRFHSEFNAVFSKRFKIISAEQVQEQIAKLDTEDALKDESGRRGDPPAGWSWEAMRKVGKEFGADTLAGLLMEESDEPGYWIEHIQLVKTEKGKVIASNNFLVRAVSNHSFAAELKKLEAIFKKIPK